MFVFALFAGCTGNDGYASAYVKDAPSDTWRAVHITFTAVSIHQSGDNTTGWTTLYSSSGGSTVDLLNTSGLRAAFLGETGLPAGHYQQMRITVLMAHGILSDGTAVNIGLPQGGELKLSKSFKVQAGKETQIVIDFDLEHSLTQKNGAWEFKPVVGKIYAAIKDKTDKPEAGKIESVDLKDDAAE